MMRYVPTNQMIEESGFKWLKEYEAENLIDYRLEADALCIPKQGVEIHVDDIMKLHLRDYERHKRVPEDDDYMGVPLYYGGFGVCETSVIITSSRLNTKDNQTALIACHSPYCRIMGARWAPRLPDSYERDSRISRLLVLYRTVGLRVRRNHIERVCRMLRNGQSVSDCGTENIIFHPAGVSFMQVKSGFWAAVLDKREPFECKYSDLIVHHVGDPYFPDKVELRVRGLPDASLTFEKKNDVVSPYLILPIVNMMKELEENLIRTSGNDQRHMNPAERLKVISDLFNSGSVTKEEYDAKRKAILDSV